MGKYTKLMQDLDTKNYKKNLLDIFTEEYLNKLIRKTRKEYNCKEETAINLIRTHYLTDSELGKKIWQKLNNSTEEFRFDLCDEVYLEYDGQLTVCVNGKCERVITVATKTKNNMEEVCNYNAFGHMIPVNVKQDGDNLYLTWVFGPAVKKQPFLHEFIDEIANPYIEEMSYRFNVEIEKITEKNIINWVVMNND